MIWKSTQPTESQQQALQQQVKWKYPERTVLKSWAIEVRDYDTKTGNWIYVIGNIIVILPLVVLILLFATAKPSTSNYITLFIGFVIGFLLLHWLVYSVTFAKKFLVYRFTRQGFEVAGWNRQAAGQQKIFIGVAVVCSVVALVIVALVPQAFFLLFIGPVGIILVVLSQTANKQAWEQQKDYSQKDFDWDLFTEILLYKERHILTLFFDVEERNKRLGKRSDMEKINIFCYLANYQALIELIQSKVNKNTPCQEGRVEIDPYECC